MSGDTASTRLYPLGSDWMTTLFYGGLLAWALILFAIAWDWSWGDKLFPLVFTGLASVLIVVQLTLIHFGDRLQWLVPDTSETGTSEISMDAGSDTEGRVGRERERYELIMIAWVLALPAMLQVIGFLSTIPVYTFVFIVYFIRNVRTAVLASALATGLVYLLFVRVLGIRLPEGLIFG